MSKGTSAVAAGLMLAAAAGLGVGAQERKGKAEGKPGGIDTVLGKPAEEKAGEGKPDEAKGASAPAAPLAPGKEPGTAAATEAAAKAAQGDAIPLAGWDAGAVHVPSNPEAWGGERTGKEPTLSDRVADYDLKAVLDPVKHTVEGTERLRWRNRSKLAVRSLYFHVYLNAFEGPETTFMQEMVKYGAFRTAVKTKKGEWGFSELKSCALSGKPCSWRYVQPDGGGAADHTVLRVDLPEPVAPGATAQLDLQFHDQLPRVVARTGYFDKFHLVAQWFPKIGVLELPGERGATEPRWNVHELHVHSEFYADWGTYDLEVVAPKGYVVGAIGERQGPPRETPEGVVHRFHQDDVHDSAFAAWDGFAPPLTARWTGPGSPEVSVQVLYPAEYEQSAKDALQATLDSLKYFSETLGPYPYRTVTVVVPPFNALESGGMEYETFFTTVGFSGAGHVLTRFVTVHEFGHGYFMGLLASNEFEEPFLDEGMNEFWHTRMTGGERLQYKIPWLERLGWQTPSIGYWEFERATGTSRTPADPIAGNAWHRWSSGSYNLIYPRSVVVFHDLEQRLGSEGFSRAMRLYYQRWHHRHPSTADLEQALIDGTGKKELVERWFEEQVYSAAPVDDRLESVEAEELVPRVGPTLREGKRIELDQDDVDKEIHEKREAWKKEHPKDAEVKGDARKALPGPYPFRSVVKARRFAYQVPQTVVVTFDDGTSETLDWPVGERWHRWVFDRPTRVTSAQLDPKGEIFLDLNKLDDGRTREGAPLAAHRWAHEAGAWGQLILSIVESL